MSFTSVSNALQLIINFSLIFASSWLIISFVIFLFNRLTAPPQCSFGRLTKLCPSNVKLPRDRRCLPGYSHHLRLKYDPQQNTCCCMRCCQCMPMQIARASV